MKFAKSRKTPNCEKGYGSGIEDSANRQVVARKHLSAIIESFQ